MNADLTDSRRLKDDFVQAFLQLTHHNLGNYNCFWIRENPPNLRSSVFYSCSRLKYYENLITELVPSFVQFHPLGLGQD